MSFDTLEAYPTVKNRLSFAISVGCQSAGVQRGVLGTTGTIGMAATRTTTDVVRNFNLKFLGRGWYLWSNRVRRASTWLELAGHIGVLGTPVPTQGQR